MYSFVKSLDLLRLTSQHKFSQTVSAVLLASGDVVGESGDRAPYQNLKEAYRGERSSDDN